MQLFRRFRLATPGAAFALAIMATLASAQVPTAPPPAPVASYADLADLADSAPLVIRAQAGSLKRVEDARAPGLRAGHGRFYVKASTRALLVGDAPLGEALAYLVDLPLDARGKPPALKKRDVLLFARAAGLRPGELQLVAPDAQILWDVATEARLREILRELHAPGAPGRITGVREMIHVPGALSGEGETQIFLTTADGSAASITVRHAAGGATAWGVSFNELLADAGNAPARETLAWYRLACFLPDAPPRRANLSDSAASRARAEADYRMVLGELGVCPRLRR